MTIARSKQVDATVTRWYHCISRCVRRAKLLGEGDEKPSGWRKQWIEDRMQQLDRIFAVSVAGYSLMDNHFHVLLRIDPDVAAAWQDEEVIRRWFDLYPPRGPDRKPLPADRLQKLIKEKLADKNWLVMIRERLQSLSWFMKCLKEPLSRLVNKAEECTGAFFEGRFKSIAVLDEEALIAVCAYIDLNPVSAGLASTPEASDHTSVQTRVAHVADEGRVNDLQLANLSSVAASAASSGLEDDLWLVPIENRRALDSKREGMFVGFSLGNYLKLVEYTGRMFRHGKSMITAEVTDILERIGSSAEQWHRSIDSLRKSQWIGRAMAGSRERILSAAKKLGVSRLRNILAGEVPS